MSIFATELKWAARRLWRTPGSSLAAVTVLSLSIASTVTVFTVARSVLLAPLPFQEPERLVVLERRIGDDTTPLHSPVDLIDLREHCQAFSGLSGSTSFRALLTTTFQPTYVTGASVTPDYLETLGARPILGQIFRAQPGGRPADSHDVVVSWRLWRKHFRGDPTVLGKTILVGEEPYRVVAVMPEETGFLGVDLWVPGAQGMPRPPMPLGPELLVRRDLAYVTILGRLRTGWSLESARAALDAAGATVAEAYPADYPEVRFTLEPLKNRLTARARDHLTILWACVAVVFLLGCLSVSGLLLARGIARYDHDAIKLTLGATRRQAALAGFTESLLLAVAGGSLGGLASIAGIRLFLALAPPFPRSDQTSVDPWICIVAAGSALVAALLAGLFPMLRTLKHPPGAIVSTTGRSHVTRSRKYSWNGLLTLQVACMVVLLVAASILARRLLELSRLDLGFTAEGVLVALLELPPERYSDPSALAGFYQELLGHLEALPDSASVGAALPLPLSGGRMGGGFSIVGAPVGPGNPSPSAAFSVVSHGYFRTLGIRVLAGRGFGPDDRIGAPPVGVVNQALADRYWKERTPVGAELVIQEGELVRIVGVVQDVRHSLTEPRAEPRIYRPILQRPSPATWLAIRARQSPENLGHALRLAVNGLDRAQPVPDAVPMEQMLSAALQPVRYLLLIVGALAGLAMVITVVGLYSLLALTVREEERGLALRLALGAPRSALLRIQIGRGLFIATAGTLLGTIGALAGSPLLERALSTDQDAGPVLISTVVLLVVVSSALSSLLGARQVLRLSPTRAVREP